MFLLCAAGCNGPAQRDPAGFYRSALAEHRRGEYPAALAKARAGAARLPAPRYPEWHWRFRLLEAETLLSTGSVDEAARLLEPGPPGRLPNPALEARRLLNLGWIRSLRSANPEALALLDRAVELATAARNNEVLAQAEIRRGTVLSYLKRPDEAERSYQSSLALARSLKDPYLEGSALGNLGFLRLNLGAYEEAIFYFEQVLPLARSTRAPALEALTIGNLGWCFLRLGGLEKAAQHFEQAQALLAALGKHLEQQVHLGNLGSVWFIRGDYAKAIGYYRRALEVARRLNHQRSAGDWLSNLATAYLELGDVATAAGLNAEARSVRLASGEKQPDAWLTVNDGRILEARHDLPAAESRYRQVATSQSAEPATRFEASARLARLLDEQQRLAEADRQYRDLLAGLRQYRGALSQQDWKITWQSSLIRFYKDYVGFLWRNGRREEALGVAESSRAQVLAEQLGEPGDGPVSPTRLRSLARDTGCTLLSYWLAGDESYLWTITGGGIKGFTLPRQSEIAPAVESHLRTIERLRDPLRSGSQAAENLSRTLLGPLRSHEGCFIISPDQELHTLNFETLPVAAENGASRYWLESAEVSVVPSLAIPPARASAHHSSTLLIGDPVPVDPVEYPRLANAGAELDAVTRFAGRSSATVLRGAEATPGAYRKAGPASFGIIHIAAHAAANRESPLDSAIVLSREGPRYSLSAREIARIPIRANLVTISACRGAGSRAYAGEGTVGLAWGFLHAGARNVIAGLWAVDDVSTSRLMERLYARLAGGATPAAALRSAKLELLNSDSSMRKPYYWAPFQLYRLP